MPEQQPVTVIYHSNYAALTRGGQKSLRYLLGSLDRSKVTPVLFCNQEGELTAWARCAGIPVEVLPLPRLRPWRLVGICHYITRLYRSIRRYHCRVFHTEELTAAILAAVVKPLTGIRIVWQVRVLWNTPVHKQISRWFVDQVVGVSRAVSASFPASAHAITIYNGIDPQEWQPSDERFRSPRFADNAIVVGFTGALTEQKGPETLIRAMKTVTSRHPAAIALLVGDGAPSYRAHLLAVMAETGTDRAILFWGEDTSHLAALVSRFDVFVLPSATEGLSRSLLEAMACARPIVASAIPQNTELITDGETGLLCAVNDPGILAQKIITLIENPAAAAALGAAARTRVSHAFSLTASTEQWYAVYDRLAGNHPQGGQE